MTSFTVVSTIFFACISLCILAAWIHSDLGRQREIQQLHGDFHEMTKNFTEMETRYLAQKECAEFLTEKIGEPEGVVFFPEKSYYEDNRSLAEAYKRTEKLLQEKQQKLISIYNFVCDVKDGPKIGEVTNPSCQFGCKPKGTK